MDFHAWVWLRCEDPTFVALPRLKGNPNTFKGEHRCLQSAFFVSFFFFSHFHTPKLLRGP